MSSHVVGKSLLAFRRCFTPQSKLNPTFKRFITERKRFYKNVSVTSSDGKFEINLDNRKLKTPSGNIFSVNSEALAIAVATEWDSQQIKILQNRMHLTALCNKAIDYPITHHKDDIANDMLSFLDTDTICFRSDEPEELKHEQDVRWDPILQWFNERHEINIQPSYSINGLPIDENSKQLLKRHILSYNDWSILGIQSAVEVLKSFILALATICCHLEVEDAVSLSRLEVEFQTRKWGNVEWAHDFDLNDSKARLAAAVLFSHLNNESVLLKQKTLLKH